MITSLDVGWPFPVHCKNVSHKIAEPTCLIFSVFFLIYYGICIYTFLRPCYFPNGLFLNQINYLVLLSCLKNLLEPMRNLIVTIFGLLGEQCWIA